MPKKSNKCPQLKYKYYGWGASIPGYPDARCTSEGQPRIYFCEVLRDATGIPSPLESERLARDCRGDYKRCLIPFGLKAELLRLGIDPRVDEELLRALDIGNKRATILLNSVRNFLNLPRLDGNEAIVADVNLLTAYNAICPDRKLKHDVSTYAFGRIIQPLGIKRFGIELFRLLECYLLERNLIDESIFVD